MAQRTHASAALMTKLMRRTRIRWKPPAGETVPGRLAVRRIGEEGPPAVLLHGLFSSGRYWGSAFDEIAEHGRLFVPDLLGFGSSPASGEAYDSREHVDAIAQALTDLGLDEPAVIVGHSLGCLLAIGLAIHHPRLVSSIVGFGPPVYPDATAARTHVAGLGLGERLLAEEAALFRIPFSWLCQAQPLLGRILVAVTRPDLPAGLVSDCLASSWTATSRSFTRVLLGGEAAAWLARLDIPVLFLAGTEDHVPQPAFLLELANRHAHVSVEFVARADHHLPLIRSHDSVQRILSLMAPASAEEVGSIPRTLPGRLAAAAAQALP